MRYIITIFLICKFLLSIHAQKTIKGTITDAANGEALIGATVYDIANKKVSISNNYGYYIMNAALDSILVSINYIGYEEQSIYLKPSDSTQIIKLNQKLTEIESVVVKVNTSRTQQHGQYTLTTLDFKNTPVLMAEIDILKTIQMLPGVQQNREGTSGFSVRGGSQDQNLILMDGIPVYNINHLFGFVSVFNTDATNKVSFYKGGIPAHYGGRLSSVTDVVLREGNKDHYTGDISVGILSSKFTFEGPVKKNKSSFLIAGRRSVYDLLAAPITYIIGNFTAGYYMQDLTAKLNYSLNPNNTLFISAYAGNDKAYSNQYTNTYTTKYQLGWSNITSALRWNNSSMPNLFSNVTLAYTRFKYLLANEDNIKGENKQKQYKAYYSGINDLIIKWDLTYYKFENHKLNFGIDQTWHIFNPGISEKNNFYSDTEILSSQQGNKSYGHELNGYFEDNFQAQQFTGNIGIRYSLFYAKGKYYRGVQPRLSAEYKITENFSFLAGYNRLYQYLQMLSNSNIGMPTDLWLPITKKIPPQQCYQYSVGLKYRIKPSFSVCIESFVKEMKNITDYKDGIVINNQNNNWDNILEIGSGKSKGIELMVEKREERINGWIAYTLSKSERKFGNINDGNKFPFQYDRRHVINLFLAYKIKPNKSLSLSWVYSSGWWMTINHDNYYLQGQLIMGFNERNNYQTPSYHHLDISYTSSKEKKRGTRSLIFGVYNIYGHTNPFSVKYIYKDKNENPVKPYLREISLFPAIPYVAYEYKFK